MDESPSFKKETREDLRAIAEREVQKLKHEIDELRYQLNGVLGRIDAQNEKAKADYREDPSKDVDSRLLDNLAVLQRERENLESKIEKKTGKLNQLRMALK
ncbi:MAG: hypothetical protein HZA36_02090 [Parcubacteria group bacterium]|nr:hypothetical protein [Parcubacteria group bacterium]